MSMGWLTAAARESFAGQMAAHFNGIMHTTSGEQTNQETQKTETVWLYINNLGGPWLYQDVH
jgi:hypothetical protein